MSERADAERPEAMPPDTVTLIGRARAGDEQAFTELFRRYLPRVRGLVSMRAGRSLQGVLENDDIVQQALTDALMRLDQLEVRSEAGFICMLGRLVDARLADVWRRYYAAKRGAGGVRLMSDLGTTTRERNAPRAGDPSASEEFARREDLDRIESAILQLGERSRLVVYLRLVLDMPWSEVAREMQLATAEAARSLFNKASARLRRMLKVDDEGHGPVSSPQR